MTNYLTFNIVLLVSQLSELENNLNYGSVCHYGVRNGYLTTTLIEPVPLKKRVEKRRTRESRRLSIINRQRTPSHNHSLKLVRLKIEKRNKKKEGEMG